MIGLHDYNTGLDLSSLSVTADFPIDGADPGKNLAARFKPMSEGVHELKLREPIKRLERGTLSISVKDRQGNVARIERTISVGQAGR